MKRNSRENEKPMTSKQAHNIVTEPYVGMPIYLDDNCFYNKNMREAIDEKMDDERLSDQFMLYRETPTRPIAPMPDQGTMPPTTPIMPDQGTMPPTRPIMPDQGTMPPTTPIMPDQGTMPPTTPIMPDQGTMPPTIPIMPDQGTMPPTTPIMPDQGMVDRRYMPEQYIPNQGTGVTEGEFGFNVNDCDAGCTLAMAYVPWQSWEKTYDDEVAFRVGTVFPSLDLPFLGGKRK